MGGSLSSNVGRAVLGTSKKHTSKKRISNKIGWDDTQPFIPPLSCGRVIKVYDGDTITIAAKMPFRKSPIYRFHIRLAGIDTPEIRTKSQTEKKIAILARDFLANKIHKEWVYLENLQLEKYGRVLADVWFKGVCLNQLMVDKRFAVKYDGGTKHTPQNWESYYNSNK